MPQQLTSRWLIFGLFVACFVHQPKFALAAVNDVTFWSEDAWLESQRAIDSKFVFNRERYERVTIRTRMDEWSFELSLGNGTRSSRPWTELHLFLDRRLSKTRLNNATNARVSSLCHPAIISPLTNDSTVRVPELADMDQRIADYFITDGFFRTINFIHCTINDRRRRPSLEVLVDIYLVTNREFQSLLMIKMDNSTLHSLISHQARFYTHNSDPNFKFNLNVSDINRTFDSQISYIHMIKLYNTTKGAQKNSATNLSNTTLLLSILLCFQIFFWS